MSAQSDFPTPAHEPTRALLLAQALETCIEAERRVPGSADRVIAHQPAWARAELRRLVALAGSLDAAATSAVMSEDFRVAARARLMRRISTQHGADLDGTGTSGHSTMHGAWLTTVPTPAASPSVDGNYPRRPRTARWLWRGGAGGLLAATLVLAATLTASASALPGEPLYGIKQAREELNVRLAPDENARALALLGQADARLDETTRLLAQGRTDAVTQTTQRFDDSLDRATTTYVVTIADAPRSDQTTETMQSKLTEQQQQLQMLLATAPEPARADLREALVATQRSRALVADRKPLEEAESAQPAAAAEPTAVLESTPTQAPAAVLPPPPIDLVAPRPTAVVIVADRHETEVSVQQTLSGPGGALARTSGEGGRGRGEGSDKLQDVQLPQTTVSEAEDGDHGGDRDASQQQRTETPAPARVVVVPREQNPTSVTARAQEPQQQQTEGGDDVAQAPTSSNGRGGGDDRTVAPSQNQDEAHERVAQQQQAPAAVTAVPVVARQADSDGHGGDGNATGTGNVSRQSSTAVSSQPAVVPTPAPTSRPANTNNPVRAQATPAPSTGDGRHQDGNATTQGTTSRTTTTTTTSSSSSGDGGSHTNTNTSGGTNNDGGGHGH